MMKKLTGKKIASVYTCYNGEYITCIFLSDKGEIYGSKGLELDLEGKLKLLQLKYQGYSIEEGLEA